MMRHEFDSHTDAIDFLAENGWKIVKGSMVKGVVKYTKGDQTAFFEDRDGAWMVEIDV